MEICKLCLRENDFLVDLEKCCKMRIWTRKSALIQPRTSFGKSDGVVAHPARGFTVGAGTGAGTAEGRASHTAEARRIASVTSRGPGVDVRKGTTQFDTIIVLLLQSHCIVIA